jgi:serine/threonine-protein kinase
MADTAQFPPGEMLDDKYRIDQLLSVGGMGAVYVGTHTLLRKRVAIKVLRTELAGSTAMIERFQREAVAASAIGHENIVSVTDMGTTAGGVAFLVMELLEGRSLAQAIRTDGPLPVGAACDVASEILSGVSAAHGAGIVHRDLKPENVFLSRRASGKGEAVKILDFGISSIGRGATPEPRLTVTGIVMGTPSYMAPEQARGDKDITALADIYSIGVILYEMLCKQLPYEAENYNMIMYRVLSGEHVPLTMRRPELGQAISDIVEKAMALDARDRFPSADAFEQALGQYRGGTYRASSQVRVPAGNSTPPPAMREMSTAETLAASSTEMDQARRTPPILSATLTASPVSGLTPPPNVVVPATEMTARPSRLPWIVGGILLGGAGIAAVALGLGGKKPASSPTAAPVAAPVVTNASSDAAPAPPPPLANVVVDFMVTAPGAVITVDGKPVTGTRLEAPASTTPAKIRVEAPGYDAFETTMTLDRSMVLPVQLAKAQVAAEPSGKSGRRPRSGGTTRPSPTPVVTPPVVEPPPVVATPPAGEKKPKDSHIVTDSPYATPKH